MVRDIRVSYIPKCRGSSLIERIHEGTAEAKHYGTRSGRLVGWPPQISVNLKKYYPMWKEGDITATGFARLIGVSWPTPFINMLRYTRLVNYIYQTDY